MDGINANGAMAGNCQQSPLKASRGALAGLGMLLMLVTGCGDIHYELGRPFSTDPLESSLTVGESGESEVRQALGEPDGVGRYLAPVSLETRPMWAYYYETGTAGAQADRTMLFVLFRGKKYDGYLWFSDTPTPTPE